MIWKSGKAIVSAATLLLLLCTGMPALPAHSSSEAVAQSRPRYEEVVAENESAGHRTGLDDRYGDVSDEDFDEWEEEPKVADPIEPFNRAMFGFNDRLYFWVIRPASRVYRVAFPESFRISVRNFFSNLLFPNRLVNCVLQGKIKGAGIECTRFTVNSTVGIGGLFDPAGTCLHLAEQDEDFGQTFGEYGAREGIFITWPILGPSTLRDSVGLVGDFAFDPVTYVHPLEAYVGVNSLKTVNNTSLKIGDYEAIKEAAIDPYFSVRDAYIQYRRAKIRRHPEGMQSSIEEKTDSLNR
ncbi:MAG: VacJ family lipoprotein [bacterium]